MLQKYALAFFVLSLSLERAHQRLGIPLPAAFDPIGYGSLGGAVTAFPALLSSPAVHQNAMLDLLNAPPPAPSTKTAPPNPLSAAEREDVKLLLEMADVMCRKVQIPSLSNDIKWAKDYIETPTSERERAKFHIEHLTQRIIYEMRSQSFLHVQSNKEDYYEKSELFGPDIGKKFSKFAEDITNAGTSFALGLHTACVFHLMRVMEHCVQRFGTRLKVSIEVKNEPWANIMDHVNREIEKLPGGPKAAPGVKATPAQRARRQQMKLAADRLDHVRIVWRNDTMHPKATYDEQEALDVLNGVKAFLGSIVKLV